MNILDKLDSVLNMSNVKLGYLPNEPDNVIGLFEYSATPPEHSFGHTDFIFNIQVRVRNKKQSAAYEQAEEITARLNRYHDNEISVLLSTPILDIGRDSKQRQEYTINFEVRRI